MGASLKKGSAAAETTVADTTPSLPADELESFLAPACTIENMDRYLIRTSILRALQEFLPNCRGELLDVGCGVMPYKSLVPGHVRYIGMDIDNPVYQQNVTPDLFWDGATIPLTDGSVSCAMATELFEHLLEPETVMREILRVLKPGGVLFFTVPFLWSLHDVPHDQYRYTPFALERHLRNAGFDSIVLKPLGGWDASLAQMIGLWARRKPMPEAERARLSAELFPWYCALIEQDERPAHFSEGQMLTGLYGTATKPGIPSGEAERMNGMGAGTRGTGEEPLKICYLLLHIPVPSETFVINEILALQAVGVDVYTVALWPPQDCHAELMGRVLRPVHNLFSLPLQQSASKQYISAARQVARQYGIADALADQAALAAEYVVAHRIRHIHAHFASEAALVALIVSRLTGIPFSFTAHAYDIFRLNVAGEFEPYRRLKLLIDSASRIITVSEYNKQHFIALTSNMCSGKLKIIHYGMDLKRFNKFERRRNNLVTFLTVGRLVEKKGHEYLLRAFRQVLESCDARLRIVGDGELRPALTALADELGIADRVTFVGAVSSDVVLDEMRNADVFVLHSITAEDGDREGMPVAIMEACATGLPVVSTLHAGIPELIVQGESGVLVEERDWQGCADAMLKLALSPELRVKMGEAGHRVVAENFNILHEAQKLKDIFCEIIAEHDSRVATGPLVVPAALNKAILSPRRLKQEIKRIIKRLIRGATF